MSNIIDETGESTTLVDEGRSAEILDYRYDSETTTYDDLEVIYDATYS